MPTRDCEKFEELLGSYLEGELADAQKAAMDAHAATCLKCASSAAQSGGTAGCSADAEAAATGRRNARGSAERGGNYALRRWIASGRRWIGAPGHSCEQRRKDSRRLLVHPGRCAVLARNQDSRA